VGRSFRAATATGEREAEAPPGAPVGHNARQGNAGTPADQNEDSGARPARRETRLSTAETTAVARAGRSALKWLVTLALTALVLLGLYTWFALNWAYSSGERAGLLQKFSERGWVCKTYEGELAMYVVAGVQPEIWRFTVRDPAVAQQLMKAVGQRVQLRYDERIALPTSCFGDTRYFVDRFTPMGDAIPGVSLLGAAPAGATPPAAPPAAPPAP
jgi:hypothetical protein